MSDNIMPDTSLSKDTDPFYTEDPFLTKDEFLVNITTLLNKVLTETGVEVRYINILNLDPDSPNYNPERKIGKFRIFKKP